MVPIETSSGGIKVKVNPITIKCERESVEAALIYFDSQAAGVLQNTNANTYGMGVTMDFAIKAVGHAKSILEKAQKSCGLNLQREIGRLEAHVKYIKRSRSLILETAERQAAAQRKQATTSGKAPSMGDLLGIVNGIGALSGVLNSDGGSSSGNGLTCETDREVTC